jgi:RNA polymerase sigma-70 factor (ECF subfamily)
MSSSIEAAAGQVQGRRASSAPANDCGRRSPAEDRTAALYRAHGRAIFARCRRLLKDVPSAEDAVQEVFIRVARNIDKAPHGQQALRWLYRVATNHCLNEIRDRNHSSFPAFNLGDLVPDPHVASGEERVGDRELVRRILAVIPEELHIVAVLRHVGGLYDQEVATTLGVSRRTVVYRLGHFEDRARRALRDATA